MFELCADLRSSQLTRKQNFTDLTTSSGHKVKTYCALGAIGCEKGMIGFVENINYKPEGYQDKYRYHAPPYHTIINAYGLNDNLKHPVTVSYYEDGVKKNGLEHEVCITISGMIPQLNDSGHWTFEEIADFLESLVETNVFKVCTQKLMKNTNKYMLEEIDQKQVKRD